MPKIIGLTGGIGSGKSTIAKHFGNLGIPIYIADLEAKKIMDTDVVIKKIIAEFGETVIENEKVDRKKIAEIVFRDSGKLQILNSIIHPAIANHFANWVYENSKSDLVIKETAILFESGSYKDCDYIILVTAPKESRIQRVMKRDGLSRDSIESRMANQWSEEKKEKLSDFVIFNIDLQKAIVVADKIISVLRNK